MLSNQAIAQRLPDLPRWVEVRALLLTESCEIFGLQEEPMLAFAMREPGTGTVFVAGKPPLGAIQAALQPEAQDANAITPQEHAAWLAQALPGWRRTRIIVYSLPDHRNLPADLTGEVGFLDPVVLPRLPVSADLLGELKSGAEHSPIAATFVEHQPVSFCYAGSVTETLWDVSIDTLTQYQCKGYAALCAAFMIRHMQAQGKQPVWQALEENPASRRLAQKLGFVAVDELALFEPDEQTQEGNS